MAVKYLAGDRIIGTAAERTALTTSVEGSPTANAWKEIKRFTATGSQDELDTGTFTAKDHLMFLIYIPIVSNNHDPKLTFNGDSNSATTYKVRRSVAGAAFSHQNTNYYMDLYMHGGDAAQFVVGEIVNRSGVKKNFRYQGVASGTAGQTAVARREWFGVYNNTAQITSMKVHSGASTDYNFPTGSEIVVLGMDDDETATTGASASPTHTDNPFWNQLTAIDPLTTAGAMSTATFADKNYLYTELFAANPTNTNKAFFPNTDSSNSTTPCTFVYNANGQDSDGGGSAARNAIQITSADSNDEFSFTRCWIANPHDKEKLFIIQTTEANADGDTYNAQNAPQRSEQAGKWTATNAAITKLNVSNDGGTQANMKVGSFMRVWGND
jgi:hypothetical protein